MAGFKMKNLFKLKDLSFKSQDLLLTLVFVIYLISNAKIPLMLEKMIDTTSGNIVIIILALIVMIKFNPVVGVLGLLVAYELMRRSSISNSNILLRQNEMEVLNKELKKTTLEEEMVGQVKTYVSDENTPSNIKPLLSDLHNASNLANSTSDISPPGPMVE